MAQEENQTPQQPQSQPKQSQTDSLPSFFFPIVSAQSIAIALVFTILGYFSYGRTFDGFLFTIAFITTIGLLAAINLIPIIGFPLYIFLLLPQAQNYLFQMTGYSPTTFTTVVSWFSIAVGGAYYLVVTFALVGKRAGVDANVKAS